MKVIKEYRNLELVIQRGKRAVEATTATVERVLLVARLDLDDCHGINLADRLNHTLQRVELLVNGGQVGDAHLLRQRWLVLDCKYFV
jgi:hypothetical protein